MVEEEGGDRRHASRIAKSHAIFLRFGSAVQLGLCDLEYACKVPEEKQF